MRNVRIVNKIFTVKILLFCIGLLFCVGVFAKDFDDFGGVTKLGDSDNCISCGNGCGSNCDSGCGSNCNNGCGSCCAQAYITEYGNSCKGGCGNNSGNNKCNKCENCACKVNSRTTFVYRPQFQVCSPEYLAAFRGRMDARENGHGGAFQAVLFGGKSTDSDKIAMYFAPYCKSTLVVNENPPTRDLDPKNFNVALQNNPTQFSENISFCPHVTSVGLGLNYRQNLNALGSCYDSKCKHWYAEISTPLTWVQTTMGLSESRTFTTDTTPLMIPDLDQTFYSSMVQAFNQPAWCYGKINGCAKHSKIGLADISLMVGYEALKCSNLTLDSFAGILIPTGNKRCGKYVFEPMVGNGQHWGLMLGMHVKGAIWENEAADVSIETCHDINGMFLFRKNEIRSFDLKGKPWSRYMEIYQNEAQAQQAFEYSKTPETILAAQYLSSPGINAFTQCLSVRPGISLTSNTGFVLNARRFRGEIGYNVYFRQAECVNLCCWKEGVALKAASGDGNTEPLSTISLANEFFTANAQGSPVVQISNPVEKYSNSIIKACDLDMESASHPFYLANTVYASAGAYFDEQEYPAFFDFGASYEFEQENITLNRWMLWFKGGLSF